MRCLVAEDNPTNQKLALKMLEKLGHQVDVVENGELAVKALESVAYDLVFMDMQMPEMDGIRATQIIRDVSSKVLNREIPIIAMTANALTGDREQCLEAGMNDYLSKPIQKSLLEQALVKWGRGSGS
jgi:CheY-like chemotaxis protein